MNPTGSVCSVADALHGHRAAVLHRSQSSGVATETVHAADKWRWAGCGEQWAGSGVKTCDTFISQQYFKALPPLVMPSIPLLYAVQLCVRYMSEPFGQNRRQPVHLARLQEESPSPGSLHVAPEQHHPPAPGHFLLGAAWSRESH